MALTQATPEYISPFNEELMGNIRNSFYHVDNCPYSGPRIYLENAGGSLTLKSVIDQNTKIGTIPDNEHRNNAASKAMTEIVNKGLSDLQVFFGAKSGVVFGGETGTECLFRLIRSAALAAEPGGNIVASSAEHPSTYSATQYWAQKSNREWNEVKFDVNTGIVGTEDYAKVITSETRVATVIHTNPVTGVVMDVNAIIKTIRAIAPDCFIIVDGIQHAPHGFLNVEEYGADAYVISLYKVYSKFNNGYAWVSDRMSKIPHEALIGKPQDAWELGSRDPAALASVTEVLSYLKKLGSNFINSTDDRLLLETAGNAMLNQEHYLIYMIMYGTDEQEGLLSIPDVTILGTTDISKREGVISFGVTNWNAKDIVAALDAKGIRIHARTNDLFSANVLNPLGLNSVARVSVAHYNTTDEINTFLKAVKEIIIK